MTTQEQAEELIEAFEMFDDADGKYQFLIDLGRKLPPMDAADKTEDTRVHGCQSNVWVVAQVHQDGGKPIVDIIADSDALISKVVIAVLQKVYSGHSPEEILTFDIDTFLERVGLNHILSMGRRNGLYGMVQRIKTLAAAHA